MTSFAEKLLEAHFRQLQRVVERQGVRGLRALYGEARKDLEARLLAMSPNAKASLAELNAIRAQTSAAIEALGSKLLAHTSGTSRLAAELGARHGVQEFAKLEAHYTGTAPVLDIDRASVFAGMAAEHDRSLLTRHREATQTWTKSQIAAMEKKLAVGSLVGKSQHDMITEVAGAAGMLEDERWKAERIVRTEGLYGHNLVKWDAIKRTEKEIGRKLYKRLIETFDERTGDDSFLIHGQTVRVSKPFVWMRPTRGGGWVRESFMFPPNRPNDRATVIPWDPEWEETEEERPLTRSELYNARPTRWRGTIGVRIPPGHRPGLPPR